MIYRQAQIVEMLKEECKQLCGRCELGHVPVAGPTGWEHGTDEVGKDSEGKEFYAPPGAWVNSCFRREGGIVASEMIRQAIAITRWKWPVSPLGLVTFIDREHIKPTMVRGRAIWGWSFLVGSGAT